MPQADLTTFHSLVIYSGLMVTFFFILTFYYMTPLWSLTNKLNSKKTLVQFFLNKAQQSNLVNYSRFNSPGVSSSTQESL